MGNEEKILTILGELNTRMNQMQDTQAQMQTTLVRVAATQENVVLKSLDALAELWEEVRLLRPVVAQHSKDIEALKAAQ